MTPADAADRLRSTLSEQIVLEALMERYVDGDGVAFDTLFAQLRGPITASLRRWLRTDDKVDDALQITWMKVHNSRARYRKGAPVLPWILTIARNVALDHLRSRAAKERSLDEETARRIPDDDADPINWSAEDEQEVIAAVRDAVEQLPPSTREVVRMHKLEGRSMAEVAEILGIKEGAARVRAHRGYKALAKLLLGFRAQRQE